MAVVVVAVGVALPHEDRTCLREAAVVCPGALHRDGRPWMTAMVDGRPWTVSEEDHEGHPLKDIPIDAGRRQVLAMVAIKTMDMVPPCLP